MVRTFALVVLLAAASASAQAVPPLPPTQPVPQPGSIQPVPARSPQPTSRPALSPATKPSPEQLHAQAYDFMRQDKFDKATPLLNRAYKETPPQQKTRALVLNRALLDLVQKTNPMRAIKDVYDYMAANSNP